MIEIEPLLRDVQKPARYVGGEINEVRKNPADVAVRFAFCFPDTYEIGMSHLGMKILYHILNQREDTYCERVFAPWLDMEAAMRKEGIPLFSLETRTPVGAFDIVGFTLQYEMSYSNILNMLDMAGIPLRSSERGAGQPIVIAGGPCAFNPEPLADFIDLFFLGDGEETDSALCQIVKEAKISGAGKEEILLRAVREIPGVYCPAFYDVSYDAAGDFAAITPTRADVPSVVLKAALRDLDAAAYPDAIIVPNTEIVHDRIMLEIARGCTRGCRFCQAGILYRPQRERSVDTLLALSSKLVAATGYDEVSLSSLSTGDYSCLYELASGLGVQHKEQRINIALPSLRIDSQMKETLQETQSLRKSSLTFAPEAGSQRLRDVINKGVYAQQLITQVSEAFAGGWSAVKLYFMIGLPTETMEDIEGIRALCKAVLNAFYATPKEQRSHKGVRVSASAASFVPKAHTPFQWCAQDSVETLRQKQSHLRSIMNMRGCTFTYHESTLSYLEAAFARGDRKLCAVLVRAQELGCHFDGWTECFKEEAWRQAFADCGLTIEQYAQRAYDLDDPLPWDHLSSGVSKAFLREEYERAMRGEVTPDCKGNCQNCGAAVLFGGDCPCA